jgi:hypothetical protein
VRVLILVGATAGAGLLTVLPLALLDDLPLVDKDVAQVAAFKRAQLDVLNGANLADVFPRHVRVRSHGAGRLEHGALFWRVLFRSAASMKLCRQKARERI